MDHSFRLIHMALINHFLFGPLRHDPALADELVQETPSKAWAWRAQLRGWTYARV